MINENKKCLADYHDRLEFIILNSHYLSREMISDFSAVLGTVYMMENKIGVKSEYFTPIIPLYESFEMAVNFIEEVIKSGIVTGVEKEKLN